MIEHLNPPGLLRYDALTQVVVARGDRIVFVAGQSAYNERFELEGDDVRSQAVQALRHLRTAVEAAGGTMASIVSSTVYLTDLNPSTSDQFMAALASEGFPPHAFSIIGVAALAGPGQRVEISAQAVIAD